MGTLSCGDNFDILKRNLEDGSVAPSGASDEASAHKHSFALVPATAAPSGRCGCAP